jgi:glycosyltransferase involved in cell wall biosynthesis
VDNRADLPLVSIITPSFNQRAYIEKTLESVLSQDYPNIEYIVLDGGSTDGTRELLLTYADRITLILEPDDGQADAINKGMRLATGDILAWMNSDDYYTPGAIRAAVEYLLAHPDVDFVYGDVIAIDAHEREYGVRAHVRQVDAESLIDICDDIVQPGTFWWARVWHTCGELDASLHYTLDYEYWMRVAKQFTMRYVPIVFAKERLYSSAKTFRGSLARWDEIEAVAKRHGGAGLPRSYAAEAAAAFARHGLSRLVRGHWSDARRDWARALAFRPPPAKFFRFFGALLLFGDASLPRIWLWLNLRRQAAKAESHLPNTIST